MQTFDLEAIRQAEERLVNVWPAPSTLMMDGWVVRFANGYSSRANSASALIPGATLSEPLIETIERLYREAHLSPTVRITPLVHADVEAMLLNRGYYIKDEAAMMFLDFDPSSHYQPDPRVRLETTPGKDWLNGVTSREIPSKRSADHLNVIVGNLRVPAAFASVELDGEKLGFGIAVLDRGWAEIGSILLDKKHRGKGLGRALMIALLDWANTKGAERAFLQVEIKNMVAVKLYESLGFKEICRYRNLVLR